MAWVRYQLARVCASPNPPLRWSQAEDRYPRTPAGGWRYFREIACPAEVDWYERHRRAGR